MIARHAIALALVAVATGCSTTKSPMRVETNSAVVSNVSRHRTYVHEEAGEPPVGYATSRLEPEVLAKVRSDIDLDLQSKGYVRADDGELVVRISSGVRTVKDQPTGASAAAGAPEVPDTESSLVIDIFERSTNSHLFHGYAKDGLVNGSVDDAKIRDAVTKILSPVPATAL